jgi:hypothetical protein
MCPKRNSALDRFFPVLVRLPTALWTMRMTSPTMRLVRFALHKTEAVIWPKLDAIQRYGSPGSV